jgi:hypothetical protein
MRIGKASWTCAAAMGLWAGSSALASQAPISYVTQDRSVSATSSATGVARGGTGAAPITDNQNQSQQAGGFGTFAGAASVESNLGPDNAIATASAMQNSSLGGTGFSASGAVRADSFWDVGGPASGSSSSTFHITFNVAQAEAYTLSASLNSSLDFASIGADTVKISLTDSGGNNLFSPITSINAPSVQIQGILDPGLYSFALDAATFSNDQSDNFVNYSVTLDDGPITSNIVNLNPSAVPLPAAWMDSLVMLATLAAIGIVKRRVPKLVRASVI